MLLFPTTPTNLTSNWGQASFWGTRGAKTPVICMVLVGAVGIGTLARIENTQVIEKSSRSKRTRIEKRAKLERIWNTSCLWRLNLPEIDAKRLKYPHQK